MSAEKRIAHFTGDEQVPTDVLREQVDENLSRYTLRPYYRSDKDRVPPAALNVRTADENIAEVLKRDRDDLFRQYPEAELRFEGHGVLVRHAIMLAQTALSEGAWDNFALLDIDKKHTKTFQKMLHVVPAQIIHLELGSRNKMVHAKALTGMTEEALAYASESLMEFDISRAMNVPPKKA
ncbi:MAG TPA: hypothetical protein VK502_00755 [Candidatus Saccharimonadales bacterium]|nr:hypothetical protein [Candidatus Saccharimonadales bacterium]